MAQVNVPDALVTAGKFLLAAVAAIALLAVLTLAVDGMSVLLEHVKPHPAPAPPAPTPKPEPPAPPPAPTPKPFPSTWYPEARSTHG